MADTLHKRKYSLLRCYKKVLSYSKGNQALHMNISHSIDHLRENGLKNITTTIDRLHRQCDLIRARYPRTLLEHQINKLKKYTKHNASSSPSSTSSSSSSSSSSESDNEQTKKETDEEQDNSNSYEDDDQVYESPTDGHRYKIHRIVGFRLKGHGSHTKRMYLVRWKGYDSDDDTWEPIDRLLEDQCGDLVARFHREHMRVY